MKTQQTKGNYLEAVAKAADAGLITPEKEIELQDKVESLFNQASYETETKEGGCLKAWARKPPQAHSPLPWTTKRIELRYGCYGWEITRREPRTNQPPCDSSWDRRLAVLNTDDEETRANAAFIVRACNNAQRLADALRDLLTMNHGLDGTPEANEAREALAQWEGAR